MSEAKAKKHWVEEDKRYFASWWFWVLLLVIVSVPVLWALGAAGLLGRTVTERIIFEQSYQRKAGDSAKLATFEAQKASLERQLRRTDLTGSQRADFEAQLAAVSIQISTVKGQ